MRYHEINRVGYATAVERTFSVSVIGFNRTEQIVLNSIFALSARRTPKFVPLAAGSGTPDLYLVDASSPEYLEFLQLRNPQKRVPSILIGDTDNGTGWPVLARPLQWARLFKAFDLAVENIPKPAESPTVTPTGPMERTTAGMLGQRFGGATAPPTPAAELPGSQPITIPPGFEAPDRVPAVAPSHAAPPASPAAALAQPTFPPPRTQMRAPQAPPAAPPTPVQAEPAGSVDWVLVVDDNLTVREFMAQKLAPFRFNVEFAESGEKALFMCSQRHYTCVFLDVVMPGMDGYQVCKHIKGRKGVQKSNVIMLTSKSSPFDKIRGTMAGCDAYLTKPVNEERLLALVAKFITGESDPTGQPA
jgi:twitching motility two-component system response regulator PilG